MGPTHRRSGPQILREESRRYDRAFEFRWPVFEVELTDDPVRIREARDVSEWFSGDPMAPAPNSIFAQPTGWRGGEVKLEKGPYIIPVRTDPVEVKRPLDADPSILSRLLQIDTSIRNRRHAEDILDFVAEFGPLGSTRRRGKPSSIHGEAISFARYDIGYLQELAFLWEDVRNTPSDSVSTEQQLHLDQLVFEMNMELMEGVGPVMRSLSGETVAFTTGFTCRSLIHAAYLQLYLDITSGRGYQHCPKCGIMYVQKRSNQLYCTPYCAGAARVMRHYDKHKRKKVKKRRGGVL